MSRTPRQQVIRTAISDLESMLNELRRHADLEHVTPCEMAHLAEYVQAHATIAQRRIVANLALDLSAAEA